MGSKAVDPVSLASHPNRVLAMSAEAHTGGAMGRTVGNQAVEETAKVNRKLIRDADQEVRKLRAERQRSGGIIKRARRSLNHFSRRNGAA